MAMEGTVTSGQHPVATSYTNKRLPHTDNIKIYQTSLMAPALRHTVLQTTKTTRFSSHFQSCLSLNFFIANARRPKKPRGFLSASLRPPTPFLIPATKLLCVTWHLISMLAIIVVHMLAVKALPVGWILSLWHILACAATI